jgi:hypothetical protein
MVKRVVLPVLAFLAVVFAACQPAPTGTGGNGNPAAYGTTGARMVSDSMATMQAGTAVAYQIQVAGTRQAEAATAVAQQNANATMAVVIVTRNHQDTVQRDLELSGMATATAVANQSMATATAIALYRESLDVQHNAALVAQEAAARATAQARELERLKLENDVRRFWRNALPWLVGLVALVLVAGIGSFLYTRTMDAHRPPVYSMPVTANQLPMLRGPNGWQLLPARATVIEQPAPPAVEDGVFNDVAPARWSAFTRWQHVSQLPIGAIISGERRPLIVDRNQEPHLLVAGTTGSGKTRSGMIPYMLGLWATGANVVVVNGAGSDFSDLADVPNFAFFPPAEERDLIAPLADFFDSVVQESIRRDAVLAHYNANTWRDLPPHTGESSELLVVVDEFLSVILAADEVKQAIRASREYERQSDRRVAIEEIDHQVYRMWYAANRIASKNRKHGIHLLLSLTDPTAELLGKYGMALRRQSLAVGFRMRTAEGSRTFLGVNSRDGYPQGSVGLPTGQYLANVGGEIHRCVSFFPSSSDIRQFVQTRAPLVERATLPAALRPPAVIDGQWRELPAGERPSPAASLPTSNMPTRSDADYLRGKLQGYRSVTAVARLLGQERGELSDGVNASGDHIAAAREALSVLAAEGDAIAQRILGTS